MTMNNPKYKVGDIVVYKSKSLDVTNEVVVRITTIHNEIYGWFQVLKKPKDMFIMDIQYYMREENIIWLVDESKLSREKYAIYLAK